MTEDEINRAIADALGWRAVEVYEWDGDIRLPKQYHFDGTKATGLPNFNGDLNAIQAAVFTQPPEIIRRFQTLLSYRSNRTGKLFCELTAAEWAEDFLRAVGKWKE